MSFLRQYLSALQLFTCLPVTGPLAKWIGFGPEAVRASACHWPGVGWLVGLVACTVFALLGLALPNGPYVPLAAAAACTVATVLLTGAFHEDALIRFTDSLGRGAATTAALELTRPSFASHGAIALVLALLFKISLLAVLAGQSPAAVLAALLAGHVVSRFWPLVLMRGLSYTGDAATADCQRFTEPVDARSLLVGAGWCIVPLGVALLVQPPGFAAMGLLFSGLALFGMRKLLARRLGGFNADSVGATQQVCEIAFYLGAAVGLGAT